MLDAVVETVLEVGYYKASSNEIARRAGVTWGAIQHLFGSREQMMLEVVLDILSGFQHRVATAQIDGTSLEERLAQVMDVLAEHYEDPAFLVELQILFDLSVNPGLSSGARNELRRSAVEDFTKNVQPLFEQALGPAARDQHLVNYVLATMVGHLELQQIGHIASELPDTSTTRSTLIRALASHVNAETKHRRPSRR